MSSSNFFDIVKANVIQQAYVDLLGQILSEHQSRTPNANVQYHWMSNAITDASKVLLADTIKSVSIDKIESIAYVANSYLQHMGSAYFDSGNLESYNQMPSNVGTNVFVTSAFRVMIPEKDFRSANNFLSSPQNNITSSLVTSAIDSLLANTNVYVNLGITSGLEYALSNNYLIDYSYTANDFSVGQFVSQLNDAFEIGLESNKTKFVIGTGGGA